jgi:glucose/mannose transport system substrate-binding protein
MTNKKILWVSLAIVVVILVGAAIAYYLMAMAPKKPVVAVIPPKEEINALTIYEWWTSPGESAALNSLVALFTKQYTDTAVLPTSVVGGAGYSFLSVIKPLVTSGNPPDSFQMHAGYEGVPYYDANLLNPIDDIWQSQNLEAVIPKVVQDMTKFGGHYYSVPVDIHRANLIWYNKAALDKNKIDPLTLTTWDAFFAACDKLKAAGMQYPIQLGDTWTAAQVLEQIFAGEGIDFYQNWVNGKVTDPTDPKLLDAIQVYKKYITYVNPDNLGLSWNDAIDRVIKGDSAFNLMGDWANGEFTVAKLNYGVDYGVFAPPGTQDMYALVIDTFERPKNIQHPTNADRWLKLVSSKIGQDTFNPLKGSISARTDADVSKYNPYQQAAIADFWKAKYMYPSVVHGSGAPEDFKVQFENLIAGFFANQDVNKLAQDMTTYTAEISDKYTIKWSLQ